MMITQAGAICLSPARGNIFPFPVLSHGGYSDLLFADPNLMKIHNL